MATDLKLSGYNAVQQATCVELKLIENGNPITVAVTDADTPLSIGGTSGSQSTESFTTTPAFYAGQTFMSNNGEALRITGENTFAVQSTGMSTITAVIDLGTDFRVFGNAAGQVACSRYTGSNVWETSAIPGWNSSETVTAAGQHTNMTIFGNNGTYAYGNINTPYNWVLSDSLKNSAWGASRVNATVAGFAVNRFYVLGDGKISYGNNLFTSPSWTAVTATGFTSTDHVRVGVASSDRALFGTSTGKLRMITSGSPTQAISITPPSGFSGEITTMFSLSTRVFYVGNINGRLLRVDLTSGAVTSLFAQNFQRPILRVLVSSGITYVITTERMWSSSDLVNWSSTSLIQGAVVSDIVNSRIYTASSFIRSVPVGLFVSPTVFSPTGELLSVSQITSEVQPSSSDVSVTLSGISNTYISNIINNPIKGSKVSISKMFIDPETNQPLQIAGNPAIVFKGIVNNFSIDEGWQDDSSQTPTSIITLNCNSSVNILSNKIAGRRTNHADQNHWFSGDLSMDRVGVISDVVFDFGGTTPVNNSNVSLPRTTTG
jgi:hypothetical protein